MGPVGIHPVYKLHYLLAIGDDMEIAVNCPILKSFAD